MLTTFLKHIQGCYSILILVKNCHKLRNMQGLPTNCHPFSVVLPLNRWILFAVNYDTGSIKQHCVCSDILLIPDHLEVIYMETVMFVVESSCCLVQSYMLV